jgi:hypothetical protein
LKSNITTKPIFKTSKSKFVGNTKIILGSSLNVVGMKKSEKTETPDQHLA